MTTDAKMTLALVLFCMLCLPVHVGPLALLASLAVVVPVGLGYWLWETERERGADLVLSVGLLRTL